MKFCEVIYVYRMRHSFGHSVCVACALYRNRFVGIEFWRNVRADPICRNGTNPCGSCRWRNLGLAKFKWPERVEAIADFPVTGVGKVDKQALRTIATGLMRAASEILQQDIASS